MATPGTPVNIVNGGATYATTSDIVGAFRTLLTHISELFTPDNARSLAYINGLPDNSPHKPLDVLMELEKRGVFSHENVDPLIGLLTSLHRVDIINTCGVRDYKEKAEQAKLARGDSFGSFSTKYVNDLASNSWQQSLETINSTAEFETEHQPLHQRFSDEAAATEALAGMDRMSRTPDNNLHHQQPPLATSCPLHSLPGSEEFLPVTMATTTSSLPCQNLKTLTEGAKADLVSQLANDPEGISLMRAAVASTDGEATNSNVNSTRSKLQSLHLMDVPFISSNGIKQAETTPTLQHEATPTSYSTTPTITSTPNHDTGDVLSPPVEFKPINASLMRYRRQTSSTSTQTDDEMPLSLTQAVVIESIASSEGTGCTSGYDSIQTSSLTQELHRGTTGSSLPQEGLVPPSAAAISCHDGEFESIDLDAEGASAVVNGHAPKSSKFVPEFDSSVPAIKCSWKEKRLHLCNCICKHNSKTISKDVKISCSQQGAAKKGRKLGKACDVKLMFRLCPYGLGPDEGRFMSMKVGVHVDRKCPQLKDMATLHLKITTRLPPTEFVSERTATNRLEDFVINNFIPHEVVINQDSKCIEFLIETYLNFDLHHISVDMSVEEEEKLMKSLAVMDDVGSESNDQFVHVDQ